MAKFFGKIGFDVTSEIRPGVWKRSVVEQQYYGDVIRRSARFQENDKVNSDFTISNQISILMDDFLGENISSMLYVTYMGAKWKISNIEINAPRLILSIGGLYGANDT